MANRLYIAASRAPVLRHRPQLALTPDLGVIGQSGRRSSLEVVGLLFFAVLLLGLGRNDRLDRGQPRGGERAVELGEWTGGERVPRLRERGELLLGAGDRGELGRGGRGVD